MLAILCSTSYAAPPQQYAFADVRGGRLRGRVNATTGVRSFLGVRYAQPPLNDLRWREPLPERNWTGVRDALNFGDVCLQNPLFGWNSIENRGNMSEDCLYLNGVAPPPRPKPYPVMVYIHAGEFHFGSGADRECPPRTNAFCPDAKIRRSGWAARQSTSSVWPLKKRCVRLPPSVAPTRTTRAAAGYTASPAADRWTFCTQSRPR